MVIFHSYLSLPEGIHTQNQTKNIKLASIFIPTKNWSAKETVHMWWPIHCKLETSDKIKNKPSPLFLNSISNFFLGCITSLCIYIYMYYIWGYYYICRICDVVPVIFSIPHSCHIAATLGPCVPPSPGWELGKPHFWKTHQIHYVMSVMRVIHNLYWLPTNICSTHLSNNMYILIIYIYTQCIVCQVIVCLPEGIENPSFMAIIITSDSNMTITLTISYIHYYSL